ncbi:porin family protein [Bacteroidota bacterium]
MAQLSVGLTAGPSSSNIVGDKPDKSSFNGQTALVGSAIIEYWFAPDLRVSFQPGFSKGGTTIAFDVPGTEDETRDSAKVALDYINLPLLARVVTDGGRWYVTGGPYLALLQTASGTYEGSGESVDISDEILSRDMGVIFGVGHFFPIGPIQTYLEFRMVQGLSNIREESEPHLRMRNKGSQVHFGLLYTIGS